ncbi:MAG: IclR family transcriptional regulator [Desulfobacteraceae bacterium]|jgi:DNA-binding IclR family transcriptional regulator
MDKNQVKPNAIEKSLDILMEFLPDNPELGTLEISERMGLHKATASRILLTLARRGFLQQNPTTKKFCLGRSSLLIGQAVVTSIQNGFVLIAKPYVDQLRYKINETIVFERLIGKSTIMVYVAEGLRRHRIAGTVGDRLPIYAAAGAKAILAFSDSKFVEDIVTSITKFEAITPNTIIDPQILIQHLRKIRLTGVAFDNQETEIGINALAVPVFNHENVPIASVVVVGPSHRIEIDPNSTIAEQAKQTANEISSALLHS